MTTSSPSTHRSIRSVGYQKPATTMNLKFSYDLNLNTIFYFNSDNLLRTPINNHCYVYEDRVGLLTQHPCRIISFGIQGRF